MKKLTKTYTKQMKKEKNLRKMQQNGKFQKFVLGHPAQQPCVGLCEKIKWVAANSHHREHRGIRDTVFGLWVM